MKISFDIAKSERNRDLRGLPFDRANAFDFETALYLVDDRHDYGETRYIAIGYLGNRLHVLCFVETVEGIRVISLRKANAREAGRYGKAQTPDQS